jgi:type IV secretion system protein VirB2
MNVLSVLRSDNPSRRRAIGMQCLLVLALLLVSSAAAQAGLAAGIGGLGGGMPWEGPLQQIESSVTGPVSHAIGIVAIVTVGAGMAFSEGGGLMRKALWVLAGLTIAFNAASWGLPLFGFAGGLLV